MTTLACLAAERLQYYEYYEDCSLYGYRVPIVVLGFPLMIGGIIGAIRTSYSGTYSIQFLLFSATLITVYPIFIMLAHPSGILFLNDLGSYSAIYNVHVVVVIHYTASCFNTSTSIQKNYKVEISKDHVRQGFIFACHGCYIRCTHGRDF